ncbi:MAG: bifunctional [glutamine synthetase] adenylyltransferase/[glutamine synthetase]-adenylyl-L-tyrosine phosphorylase [Alphaproteobacteria bacterium]
MSAANFSDLIDVKAVPAPWDRARAAQAREDFRVRTDAAAAAATEAAPVRALLGAVFGNSPYLTRLCLRRAEDVARILDAPPEETWQALLDETAALAGDAKSESDLMRMLRLQKQRAALLIAFADLAGIWTAKQAASALTAFADRALGAAIGWYLADAARKGAFTPADRERPLQDSGYIVLGMGKYGAYELNYSSDIDLVVLFERETLEARGVAEPQRFAIALTRALVRILQEVTADGYVFRTDLRLRPDAGATQIALSTEAAEHYYEAMGQNWERAAFVKARPCAGDIAAGGRFLEGLRPFVWRKYLDFAAIEDIHSIKRQIRVQTGARIRLDGHNIKLGAGGIREIEFFAQTQQLIAGGRIPDLRARGTETALDRLAEHGLIDRAVARELTRAYWFLRHVEHRLQMIEDQQTHKLPQQREAFGRVACFCGYSRAEKFRRELKRCLETVQEHYGALFESAPPLAEEAGSLVFTGVEDDPDTIETLVRLGFRRPSDVAAAVRGWHHGRLNATRTARAREMLTALMPALLKALGATPDPDQAFARFDQFLKGLPAGVQFFSLLQARPEILDLLAQALGTAPRLAGYLARNPRALESLAAMDGRDGPPDPEEMKTEVAEAVASARHFEEALDAARRVARERTFLISLDVLKGELRADRAGAAFAGLAEAVIAALYEPAKADLARRHGHVPGGELAVVAMGKLGGREMTASSDLDLIFIYDHPEDVTASDGPSPLAPNHYFARLSQRLISALTAPTAEGKLYDVDMRLRPSGNAGPIATRLDGFEAYHRERAWIWEHMALTRARVVAAPPDFAAKVAATVKAILCTPRDPAKVKAAVLDMRARLLREQRPAGRWALKEARGGIVDLEFIVQALQLCAAADHPSVLGTNTQAALDRLTEAKALRPAVRDELAHAGRLYQGLTQILAVAVAGNFAPESAPVSLKQGLARAGGAETFEELDAHLAATQAAVWKRREQLIGKLPDD